jgi:hypothetical protein
MTFTATAMAIAALGAPAPPHLIRTPEANYSVVRDFVSVGVTVRLDRRFASSDEQHRYAVVAAPHLKRGLKLPGALFGGTSLGRISGRHGIWYAAEALQLKRRHSVEPGARWQIALVRSNRVVGVIKTARLRAG